MNSCHNNFTLRFATRTFLSVIVLFISLSSKAQQVVNKGDSYYVLDSSLTVVLQQDTVITFNNGEETFYGIVLQEYVPDTTLDLFDESWHFKEDTFLSFSPPLWYEMRLDYSVPIYDTLRDPDDLNVILFIDTITYRKVHYGERVVFHPHTVDDEINRIEQLALQQNLIVESIRFNPLYSIAAERPYHEMEINEMVKAHSFEVIFTFVKEDYKMRYPVLFETENP